MNRSTASRSLPNMEKQLGLKKLALDSLIDNYTDPQGSREDGDQGQQGRDVAKAIEKVPTFQKNGAFDFQQYQDVLKMNRLTPAKFEEAQEHDLMIQKARQQDQGQGYGDRRGSAAGLQETKRQGGSLRMSPSPPPM